MLIQRCLKLNGAIIMNHSTVRAVRTNKVYQVKKIVLETIVNFTK